MADNKSDKDLMNGVATNIGHALMEGIKAAVDKSLDEKLPPAVESAVNKSLDEKLPPAVKSAVDSSLDEKFKENEKLILENYDAFEKKIDDKNEKVLDTIHSNTQAQISAALANMYSEQKKKEL